MVPSLALLTVVGIALLVVLAVAAVVGILVMKTLLEQARTDGSSEPEAEDELPYRRKDYLLSQAERSFYNVLLGAVPADCVVFVQVSLSELLYVVSGTNKRTSYQNKINAKHVDFVICDRDKLRPLVAIELDDSSHARADRQKRDEFLNQACANANLPLLRIPVQSSYNQNELRLRVENVISAATP